MLHSVSHFLMAPKYLYSTVMFIFSEISCHFKEGKKRFLPQHGSAGCPLQDSDVFAQVPGNSQRAGRTFGRNSKEETQRSYGRAQIKPTCAGWKMGKMTDLTMTDICRCFNIQNETDVADVLGWSVSCLHNMFLHWGGKCFCRIACF